MNNLEIIVNAMEINGLDPLTDVVDTFIGWRRKGYSVKRGEKAKFKTMIWKPVTFKKKDENGAASESKKLILVPASFFTKEQVEKLEEAC